MKYYLPEGRLIKTAENAMALSCVSALEEAQSSGKIVEAKAVMCDYSHNLIVDLGCMKGIIPREEGAIGIIDGTVRDIALISRVNKSVCFVIKSIVKNEQGEYTALLSRREAQQRCIDEYISYLGCGDVIDARVTHLETFGAFCDIGCGVVALMPIDAISVSRIAHPKDRFSCGDDIKAVVRLIDEQGRITLSHKELLGTWEENAGLFMPGETVSGIVRTVEYYGIFIELTPNLAGLAEPKEGAVPGQQASVYIKSIIPEKMKVKLIIIDSFDGECSKSPIKYFSQETHIDRWVYSPDSCNKIIESVFE